MSRIIPGVAVKVVKDVVVPQLSPAGVLGLVGIVEKITPERATAARASTWKEFVETFGPGSAHSLPEARQALENGVTQLVVVPVNSSGASPAAGTLRATDGGDAITLRARSAGTWANRGAVNVTHRRRGDSIIGFDLEILRPGESLGDGEKLRNLHSLPGASGSMWSDIALRSTRITLGGDEEAPRFKGESLSTIELGRDGLTLVKTLGGQDVLVLRPEGEARLQVSFEQRAGSKVHDLSLRTFNAQQQAWVDALPSDAATEFDMDDPNSAYALFSTLDPLDVAVVDLNFWPAAGLTALDGGSDASVDAYKDGLVRLEEEGDVDLVIASRQDLSDSKKLRELASAVSAHCNNSADDCKGRLGFVQVAACADNATAIAKAVEQAKDLATTLNSDRMIVVAPHGLVGAVAGRVGNLDYFQSPTFKTLAGVGDPSARLSQTHQKDLITGRVLAVAKERGRGVIMVKGIATDEEQISVRRVADRAVRGVKLIGDLFIGRLNNEDGRAALKQKLSEFLLQMQKDGAIVPSTDGKDPSFVVDVYSSQSDFSQGIVRVDLSVRPVRAIDYIYATLRVQA